MRTGACGAAATTRRRGTRSGRGPRRRAAGRELRQLLLEGGSLRGGCCAPRGERTPARLRGRIDDVLRAPRLDRAHSADHARRLSNAVHNEWTVSNKTTPNYNETVHLEGPLECTRRDPASFESHSTSRVLNGIALEGCSSRLSQPQTRVSLSTSIKTRRVGATTANISMRPAATARFASSLAPDNTTPCETQFLPDGALAGVEPARSSTDDDDYAPYTLSPNIIGGEPLVIDAASVGVEPARSSAAATKSRKIIGGDDDEPREIIGDVSTAVFICRAALDLRTCGGLHSKTPDLRSRSCPALYFQTSDNCDYGRLTRKPQLAPPISA